MEVIYTGLRQTPEQIVEAAIQEDGQVLVFQSPGLIIFVSTGIELLKEKDADDILVLGGVIPDEDIPSLKAGIKEIFTPGTPTSSL